MKEMGRFFALVALFAVAASLGTFLGMRSLERREKEGKAIVFYDEGVIWTVSGPFCEVQAFAGTKYFLLDHPQLGRLKVPSGEIKFSDEIPVAVRRGVTGAYQSVLWKYPVTQPG